ncbi:MAG: hypothetical protein R2701_06245 [Acidimicrobiales bacterium]|nr:hypothetical protein [Acidimicrobiales bacterium]
MRTSLATLLVATTLALAGCGGSDGAATTTTGPTTSTSTPTSTTTEAVGIEAWATRFCAAFGDWGTALSAATKEAEAGLSATDVAASKEAVAALFSAASDATEELIAALRDIGAPDIDGDGDTLVEDLAAKFQGFVDAADAASDDVAALDPSSSTFKADANALIRRFQEQVAEVGDSFAEIDRTHSSPGLDEAISSACDF